MGGGKLSARKTIFLLHRTGTSFAIHPGRLFGRTGMNIAILHYSVPPVVGGVESVIAHHARLMSVDGHCVRLIAARGESLNEQVPLIRIPLADSLHERIVTMKEHLNHGNLPQDFKMVRDELALKLQTALSGMDTLI